MKHWLLIPSIMMLIGCHTSNTTLISPIKDPAVAELPGGKLVEEKFDPKTTILFIEDDSASMEGHQTHLQNNVNLFVDELAKDNVVDTQVAVTTIFDSVRYGHKVPQVCEATGERMFEPNGTLVKLKAPKGKESLLSAQPANFIKRGEGFTDLLKETLKVGVKVPFKGDKCPARGPEFEEYFTTIKAAVELSKNGGPNAAFFRGNDSHLVIIILADTGDSSTLSAADVYNYLRENRNDPEGKTFTIHAVTDPGHQCSVSKNAEVDKSGKIEKTIELVRLSGGTVISMCDPQYGAKLAKLGTELRAKVTQNMTIRLQSIPEEEGLVVINKKTQQKEKKTLVLTLGGEPLPDDTWVYNTSTKTITLKDGVPWSKYPGQSIQVQYVPVDLSSKYTKKLN